MREFFTPIDLTPAEADAVARGLFAVARADGAVHVGEEALVRELFTSLSEHPADLGALERNPTVEPTYLASQLGRPDVRRLFVKTALLLAHADGAFSDKEGKLIATFAGALGIDEDGLGELHGQVKEYLLAQLSHLSNVEGAAQVARELKL